MDFWFSYIALAEVYVLLGLSTNLLVGIVGIFSVSQAAVFGVGAYIVAHFLMAAEPMPFLPALGIAAACCVLLNVLVTLPALRVSGDYFVVTSFGIQLLATAVFTNWTAGTGGANGLPGIPPPDLFNHPLESTGQLTLLCSAGAALGCLAFFLIMRAPFGRLLRAIREDESAVAAAGKNVLRAKVSRRGAGRRLRRRGGRAVRDVPELHRSVLVRSGCLDPAADHGGGRRRAHPGGIDHRAVPAAGAAADPDLAGHPDDDRRGDAPTDLRRCC